MLTNADIASSVPHLVSFLLNYSVSKGSHLRFQSILEPGLVQDLIWYGDQTVQDTISILKFQEHFYYTVFLQPRVNENLLIQDQYVVPKFSGFFAIIIALMLDIVPEALNSQIVSVISNLKQLMLREKTSTIEQFAFIILSLYNLEIQNLNLDNIETSLDLDLKMSLGLEMARYQRAPEASAILGSCVKDMETAGYIGSRECCIITTELVNCCNMMSEEAKAESLARLVLRSQCDPEWQFQHDLCHLNIALADTLMGQGEYESAETLMLNVLAVGSLPGPTQTIIRLRLNKARRRLGRNDVIVSVKADVMQPVLESMADLNRDLKVEVLAELSATVSLAQKHSDERLADCIYDTVAAMSASSEIVADWRISALVQDLNRTKVRTVEKRTETDTVAVRPGENVFELGPSLQPGLEFDNPYFPRRLLKTSPSWERGGPSLKLDPGGRRTRLLRLRGPLFPGSRDNLREKDVEKEEDPPSGHPFLSLIRDFVPQQKKTLARFREPSSSSNGPLVPKQTINEPRVLSRLIPKYKGPARPSSS